ncbi:hypothetical protein J4216_03680 [Candidatus Woesearchaeota archaeon]|nr:hypothetical protein [Candidatus Woesearchaeota archaeon]
MATVLDTSLLSLITPIFVFLLIFVIIYSLLTKTKLFGDEKTAALNFLAAVCIAAVAVFAGKLTLVVAAITPWLVFVILILAIIFGMYSWLGLKNEEIWTTIGGHITIYVVILIVILIGLVVVFEPEVTPFDEDTSSGDSVERGAQDVRSQVISTIVHPRVLGALIILVIAAISIKLLVDKV